MLPILCLIAPMVCAAEPCPCDQPCGSYLYQPAFCIDDQMRCPAEPYVPQAGDIMLHLDGSIFWKVTHYLAGAFNPNGSGIVYCRPDGTPALLEAGPNDTLWCRTLDLLPHLKEYCDGGHKVWIRRRKVPLTPEQSARLTEFALAANGKRFALGRLGLQLTPFRTRGLLRTWFVGKPHGDRASYFCSELVTESCVAAGILCRERTRPSATYPHDLFYGRSFNPFIDRHLDINEFWCPPARWTCNP
jgi:hypothetical protein